MKKILLTLMFVSFLNANSQNPVQEFNFNGNLNSADNTISFLGAPVYVNDRVGTARGAIRLTNKALQVVVGDLQQANKPRTISIWVKFNAVNIPNYIVGYGTAANAQYFGLVQQASAGGNSEVVLSGWGSGNDVVTSAPLLKETWYMYSITYDGNVSKIYRNGELLKSAEGISRSTKGYILNLGKLNATTSINADIDDLKLYNVAMTDEQVMEAYNSSKPASAASAEPKSAVSTAKKVTILPASPANKSVPGETNKVMRNVEVFSQGKKIIGVNASNIGELPEGTYLIKVSN
ncbi:LamG domain-containing protein [Flavobacterium defluvii]|uniref:Concanavalin A-like lectin/glucanases superfamily protein n=1 Tax=Flavobacterium defluvii TaxID=370979 RepID=A0A1M5HWG8_9FLAO|nr:LamG domain-containing protein [Flavobacterium defluvii]SHG20259.1 Concanavalin A-like lectin/glucanases superfamily protein [Flavobacterium defluvii]